MSRPAVDRKEQYCLYNSLAILLKAVEGERTTVDLRNEASVNGIVEQADGFMNILMKDCIFTDPRGDRFKYEIFFVQTRNIRYVHIPTHIRMISSIKTELSKLSGPTRGKLASRPTYKSKRAAIRQSEGLAAVSKILEDQDKEGD